jgi:mRNA interferase MazF
MPLTTNLIDDAGPLRIRVPAQSSLRAIDNRRLTGGPIACLDGPTMARVADALREVLDIS